MKTLIPHGARNAGCLAAALVLSACAAPVFTQPAVRIPGAFKHAPADQLHTAADGTRWKPAQAVQSRAPQRQAGGQWWQVFSDPALSALVEEANGANAGLAVAAARVRQARAIAGIAAADRSPHLGLGAAVQRAGGQSQAGAAPATTYRAGLSASYEVDLFARVASATSAAHSDAAAAAASFRSVLLVLQADVAQTYFRVRAMDGELATLRESVGLLEQTLDVDRRRLAAGGIGELELARTETELARRRAEALALQRERAHLEHALALLLGRPPSDFSMPAGALPERFAAPAIPPGLPSELLERRPDIAAAQNAMEAANARIGVARAAMFPAVSLAAEGGGAGAATSVLHWSSRSWLLGALLSAPLLDAGRNAARVAHSEAALEESVAAYRDKVLVAFSEVEDQLAGLRTLADEAAQLDAARASARRSAELSEKQYRAGSSAYLDLLDTQRQLAAAERSAVQVHGARAVGTVALIRALGGGW